jgi:hypothetical protein
LTQPNDQSGTDTHGYPDDPVIRKRLANELIRFIDNDAHRRSVNELDRVFNKTKAIAADDEDHAVRHANRVSKNAGGKGSERGG